MFNMRLAEYDLETGKFKEFLKLGTEYGQFMYAGEEICIWRNESEYSKHNPETYYEKDEEDPLKRHDGLFNGRTYGGGRFVLMRLFSTEESFVWEDVVITAGYCDEADEYCIEESFVVKENNAYKLQEQSYFTYDGVCFEELGNLHENPELYDKIKEE